MAIELGGSVFEITHDLVGDLFRAKNAGVTQLGHFANECPNLGRIKAEQQDLNPGVAKGNRDKKPIVQVKQGQLNFTGNLSIREHASLLLLLTMEAYSILTF
jgi:hypothetical protein